MFLRLMFRAVAIIVSFVQRYKMYIIYTNTAALCFILMSDISNSESDPEDVYAGRSDCVIVNYFRVFSHGLLHIINFVVNFATISPAESDIWA